MMSVAEAHVRRVAREDAAREKRQRKAAKRAEDARRTAEGRAYSWRFTNQWDWVGQPMGVWDRVERWWRGHDDDEQAPPRWWQRMNDRRSLPWVGRCAEGSHAWMERCRRRIDGIVADAIVRNANYLHAPWRA